jgi:hypothetical protein
MCFLKLIKVHLLVSELYKYQNGRCNDRNILTLLESYSNYRHFTQRPNYFLVVYKRGSL